MGGPKMTEIQKKIQKYLFLVPYPSDRNRRADSEYAPKMAKLDQKIANNGQNSPGLVVVISGKIWNSRKKKEHIFVS